MTSSTSEKQSKPRRHRIKDPFLNKSSGILKSLIEEMWIDRPTAPGCFVRIWSDQTVTCTCGGFVIYLDCAHARKVRRERGLPEPL